MKKITEMYAFVCTEDDGSEGVPAMQLGNLWFPLVAADEDRLNSIMSHPAFEQIRTPMRLVKFTTMTTIQTFNGDHSEAAKH